MRLIIICLAGVIVVLIAWLIDVCRNNNRLFKALKNHPYRDDLLRQIFKENDL